MAYYSDDSMKMFLEKAVKDADFCQSVRALEFAESAHKDSPPRKMRDSDVSVPYINHPFTLACHAFALGIATDDLISALLLHDVCEDCGIRPEELEVSDECREAVELVTNIRYVFEDGAWRTEKKDMDAYFSAIGGNKTAALVKCIDRCNNVSCMALGMPKAWIEEYIAETEKYVYPLLEAVRAVPEWEGAYWLLSYQIFSHIESAKCYIKWFD